MKNKILIIRMKGTDFFFNSISNIEWYYRCSIKNIMFRFLKKMKLPLIYLYYGNWKKRLKEFDKVILFDTGFSNEIPKYIKKKNRNIKIIYWYWNSMKEHNNKVIENKYIDEIWTYNRFDAQKYNLKYNPQFYLKKCELSNSKINSDVLFVGRDKGREKDINEIQEKLKSKNIITTFRVIKNEKDLISYTEYLNLLECSKCVLDYSFTLPCGLSLRPLEALFYEKKLITNNNDIKNYDFYDADNIFIIGEDNIENIQKFINKPYKKIDKEIVQYYSYDSWLNRFGE